MMVVTSVGRSSSEGEGECTASEIGDGAGCGLGWDGIVVDQDLAQN